MTKLFPIRQTRTGGATAAPKAQPTLIALQPEFPRLAGRSGTEAAWTIKGKLPSGPRHHFPLKHGSSPRLPLSADEPHAIESSAAIVVMSGGFQVFSLKEQDPRVRELKKRRPHQKTKGGCSTCKAKKVKVSETEQL